MKDGVYVDGHRAEYIGIFICLPFVLNEFDPPMPVEDGAKVEIFDQGRLIGTLYGRDGLAQPVLH